MSRLKTRLDRLTRRHRFLDPAHDQPVRPAGYQPILEALCDIIEGTIASGTYPANLPIEYRREMLKAAKGLKKEAAAKNDWTEDIQRLNDWLASITAAEETKGKGES